MKLLGILCFLGLFAGVHAQYYTRDAGMRGGDGTFFSYRQFFDEENAVEGMVGFSERGMRFIGLKEYLKPLSVKRSENLKFIYGYGIHAGVAYTNHYKAFGREYYHDWMWTPRFGVDGLAGIDYMASELPLLFSVANQPYFEYSVDRFFRLRVINIVFAVKYRF